MQIGKLAAQEAEFKSNVLSLLSGGGNPLPRPQANTYSLRQHREGTVPKPNQNCEIAHLKDAKLPLSNKELQECIANQPDLPWHPDFLKSIKYPANKFWVDKILEATMTDLKLYKARFKLVTTGTAKQPKFQYKINNVTRDIPPELIVKEAMSNVVVEEYDLEDVPTKVTRIIPNLSMEVTHPAGAAIEYVFGLLLTFTARN
ncbi:hypothetical protein FRC07_003016 [Ceratobasidium sp. 392]|nr:hypothetical protein FRC07_003016 [Ceratobasidium sp. 392]